MENRKSNTLTIVLVAVIAVVVGLLVGFLIEKAMADKKLTSAQVPTSATKAADLRSTLVTYGVEHMILTDQAIDAALDGNKDASATAAALYANGDDIGAAVGSIYGDSAKTTFDSVWKLHLDEFVNYAVADSKGDATAKQTALNNIQTKYTIPLAQYLAKANPNLPEATLQSALSEHVAMTATIIDDHVKGNYTQEAADLKMANTHIAGLFSTLAEGIVKQFPAKF